MLVPPHVVSAMNRFDGHQAISIAVSRAEATLSQVTRQRYAAPSKGLWRGMTTS